MLCWRCWLDWSTRVSEWVSAEAWKPPGTWQLECWKCSHNCLLFFFFPSKNYKFTWHKMIVSVDVFVSYGMHFCLRLLPILNRWRWSSDGQSQPLSPGRRNESHGHLCERAALLSTGSYLNRGLWPAARTISTQKEEKHAEPWGHARLSADGDAILSPKSGFCVKFNIRRVL